MTNSRQPMDEAGRKRHLEALFADEPFLSPTMKARRMHEKMLDGRAREGAAGERASTPFLAPDTLHSAVVLEDPSLMRLERGAAQGPRLTFQEARARLSGQGVPDPFAFSSTDPISYFRTQVLSQWFQKVDKRETE